MTTEIKELEKYLEKVPTNEKNSILPVLFCPHCGLSLEKKEYKCFENKQYTIEKDGIIKTLLSLEQKDMVEVFEKKLKKLKKIQEPKKESLKNAPKNEASDLEEEEEEEEEEDLKDSISLEEEEDLKDSISLEEEEDLKDSPSLELEI